ncbi:MAG: division/cell wall cluster transcriptional repressor MraZ [Elusimicrobia bacterium]|nr:division/cell wall cluster transcriptional repressor MraZ [Candidatus Obscuribacterium magneticum]
MFLGTYAHSIDDKGRLFIPAKLREQSLSKESKFILTQGLESCLYLFDPDTFHQQLASKLDVLPVKNQKDGRAFKRLLLAGAQEAPLDEMGRILVSKAMMEYAGLKKEVSILGVGQRIELWSTPQWQKYNRQALATFRRLGRHLEI